MNGDCESLLVTEIGTTVINEREFTHLIMHLIAFCLRRPVLLCAGSSGDSRYV